MKILGFDTSHGKSSVAISDGDRIIATFNSDKQSAQSQELISMIEQSLEQANLNYKDIDYLAVTTGPGSFTGIRIGLAAAKGIILASGIKPVAITSFEAINFRIMMHARHYDYGLAMINAYRSQVYAQGFDIKGRPLDEPVMLDLEECADYLAGFKGRLAIGGSGVLCASQYIVRDLSLHTHWSGAGSDVTLLPRFPHPEARSLCRLANRKILSGAYNEDIAPLYIRPPDAKLPNIIPLSRQEFR